MGGPLGPGGASGFTVGGGTNPDGSQNPGVRMMSVGEYGPVVRIPQQQVDLYNRLFGRNRQAAPRPQPTAIPVANTILGGRETPAPTTAPGASPTNPVADGASGAFSAILRLLAGANGG